MWNVLGQINAECFSFLGAVEAEKCQGQNMQNNIFKRFREYSFVKGSLCKIFKPGVIQIPALHSHSLVHLDSQQLLFGEPQKKKQELVPMLKRLVFFFFNTGRLFL